MTPAQRQYDIDLAASMRRMAQWIEPRSRKVSDTLRVAADRIYALASTLPADPLVQLDPHGNARSPEIERFRVALETIAKYHSDETDSACAAIASKALGNKIQPASTPEVKTG